MFAFISVITCMYNPLLFYFLFFCFSERAVTSHQARTLKSAPQKTKLCLGLVETNTLLMYKMFQQKCEQVNVIQILRALYS